MRIELTGYPNILDVDILYIIHNLFLKDKKC